MPVVSPPAITALPTPPDPNDRTTFNARAYPWSVAQQTFGTQVGLVASNVYSNANEALGQANNAAASAVAATNNGATQVALATTQANNAAASAIAATNNGAAQVALAAQAAAISAASANYKGLWSALTGALNTPASVSHNNVFWALNNPLADVTAAIPGISAAWTQISGGGIKRVARASNTQLTSVDASKIISMTGTWTQTFASAAALGDGWFCYLQNNGTGDITLDPNGSELIDGLSSYIMYPGEVRLVQCDGSALTSIVLQTFLKIGITSGTWVKPPGYQYIDGMAWGGGGSGALNNAGVATGGGGGACHPFRFLASTLPASLTYTVGSGGAAITVAGSHGNGGGNSSFSTAVAYGGGGGSAVGTYGGGGGGGIISAGINGAGGLPGFAFHTSASTIDNTGFGGGGIFDSGGTKTYGGNSVYGGGSGGAFQVGKSIYGGGAGGSYSVVTAGTSIYGGGGGAGTAAGGGTAGTAPAGGGGNGVTAASGAGARGEIRIWGVM